MECQDTEIKFLNWSVIKNRQMFRGSQSDFEWFRRSLTDYGCSLFLKHSLFLLRCDECHIPIDCPRLWCQSLTKDHRDLHWSAPHRLGGVSHSIRVEKMQKPALEKKIIRPNFLTYVCGFCYIRYIIILDFFLWIFANDIGDVFGFSQFYENKSQTVSLHDSWWRINKSVVFCFGQWWERVKLLSIGRSVPSVPADSWSELANDVYEGLYGWF